MKKGLDMGFFSEETLNEMEMDSIVGGTNGNWDVEVNGYQCGCNTVAQCGCKKVTLEDAV